MIGNDAKENWTLKRAGRNGVAGNAMSGLQTIR